MEIRVMTTKDYDQVYSLWCGIKGFGIRTVDDSRQGVEKFIKRNPTTSVVAVDNGKVVGSILCGHDGRRGCFYHVCVAPAYRQHGIGHQMAEFAKEALRQEGICKVSLIAFKTNTLGNGFWRKLGWVFRDDLNYYDLPLDEANRTEFIP